MKNLRKVLAVVLVVCMAFSLMAVASAKQITDYTDASTVQYKEAVDLMTGLGIMTGTGSTTFDPTVTFTREMAAKVTCYILLGASVSNSLTTSKSSFKDVAVTRWSAPFIEYCASVGIINGVGDGNFAPAAPITGTTMAKLLLTALGYGAKGEYTGANWEINTLVKAQSLGILDTNVNYSAAATREQVAKYVFNVLTKPACYTVTYNAVLGTYVGNMTVAVPNDTDKLNAGLGVLTFGLAKTMVTDFGLSNYKWTTAFGTVTVSGVYKADNVIYTSTNGTTVYQLLDPTNAKFKAALDASSCTYVANGASTTITNPTLANIPALTVVKGTVVELVDAGFDGDVDKVIVTNKAVQTLGTTPVTTATSGTVTTVSIPLLGINSINKNYVHGYEGLAKNDVVLYYTLENGVNDHYYIEKAASFTGTVTGYTAANGGAVTIGGTAYSASALSNTTFTADTSLFGVANVTFYVDNGGYIVKAVSPSAVATLNDYVFIRNAAMTGGLNATLQANAVFMDGTTAVVTIFKTDVVTPGTLAVVTALSDVNQNQFYTFVKNTDGTYNLSMDTHQLVAPDASFSTAKAANFLGDGSSLATANTQFIYRNSLGVFTKYTGVLNAPTYTVAAGGTDGIYVLEDATNTYALAVVGVGGTVGTTTAGAFEQLLVTGVATTVYDVAGNYYTYPALVNGVEKTIESTISNLTAGQLYLITQYTGTKVSGTATTHATLTADAAVSTLEYNAGTLAVDAASYLTSDTVKVVLWNTVPAVDVATVITVDQIEGLTIAGGNDAVTVVTDTFGVVTAIYITIA